MEIETYQDYYDLSTSSIFNKNYSQQKEIQYNNDYSDFFTLEEKGIEIQNPDFLQQETINSNSYYTNECLQINQSESNKLIERSQQQSIQKKQKSKLVGTVNIFQTIREDNSFKISAGLQIQRDGLIRFSHTLGIFSFGFSRSQIQNLEYNKQLKMIDSCLVDVDQSSPNISLEEAIRHLQHIPHYRHELAYNTLKAYTFSRDQILKLFEQIPINKHVISQHDEEFVKHIESCQEYIKKFAEENKNLVFQYGIGRVNLVKQDMEMVKTGFSKSYLDLLGIDIQNFSQMLLRRQKVDLIKDKEEIIELSLKGIASRFQYNQECSFYTANIVTFDGFPIKVYFKKQSLQPSYQCKKVLPLKFEYMFQITELDVDLRDLENLIKFRERLVSKENNLSYEDFIRKELSYLFEDVEYSVHSQSFAEKYYNKNVKKLQRIQKECIEQQSQIKSKCGYRLEHISNINPIQIISSK